MAVVMWSSVAFCALLDVVLAVVTKQYPAGLYVSIEHMQLLAVLPVAGSYFTAVAHGLFRSIRHALLSFDFAGLQSVFKVDAHDKQDSQVLEYLGLVSQSAVVNLVGYVSVGVCILMADVIVYRLLKLLC